MTQFCFLLFAKIRSIHNVHRKDAFISFNEKSWTYSMHFRLVYVFCFSLHVKKHANCDYNFCCFTFFDAHCLVCVYCATLCGNANLSCMHHCVFMDLCHNEWIIFCQMRLSIICRQNDDLTFVTLRRIERIIF